MRILVAFICICFLAISTAASLVYRAGREGIRVVKASPFTPYLQEYLRAPQPLPKGQTRPLIKGGILPINLDRQAVDDLYLSLPGYMRAERPEDVNTVVWLRWESHPAARPVRGREGIEWTCHLKVIDRASNLLVAETTFGGSPHERVLMAYLYGLRVPDNAAKRPRVPRGTR